MSWLWKGDTNSPASYEKALSKLSTQITAANLAVDNTRSRSRRVKALWTLYTTLTYLVYTLIITLVLNPHKWSIYHYGGLLGSPLLIFGVRWLLAAIFEWNINRKQTYLEDLQKQRDTKISELKRATKYDSTQELLQKYGASPNRQPSTNQTPQGTKRKIKSPPEQSRPLRTGLPPPPTANIPGRNRPMAVTPDGQHTTSSHYSSPERQSPPPSSIYARTPTITSPDEPGFAPNAFENNQSSSLVYDRTPRWYDRILDVLLGEDEMAAKNRLVLICSNCRLVNGQAPPGTQHLEEVGKWKCSSCGAWNGVESESSKVIKEAIEKSKSENVDEWEKVSQGDDNGEESTQDTQLEESLVDSDPKSQNATGHDEPEGSKPTRRITRSNKQDE